MRNDTKLPIVVGIGSSAGGLENFKNLLSLMPVDTGMAYVFVQHLAPDHESLSSIILARCTSMKVIEIKERMQVEPNHIYVLPPNKIVKITDGVLYLQPISQLKGIREAIDIFFCSLAEVKKQNAIGIILSGTGNDGKIGCKAIKDHGGLVIVQDPTTTEFNAMPQNVISLGVVDYILPIERICDILTKHRARSMDDANPVIESESYDFGERNKDAIDLILILDILKTKTKDDFSFYKKQSIKRRIQRRIEANHLKSTSEYYHYLQDHPSELKNLHSDLMIRMTNFFRNPKSFDALIEEIYPNLIADTELPFRVWVPGCSTGEEAYSIAILLMEQCSLARINRKIQIFATDIDEEALAIGRKGSYSKNIQRNISADRLEKFFKKEEKNYVVNDSVKENVLFIKHNLLRDIPFSKLNLISCRNVFIYIEPEMQKEIIRVFHFALEKNGYLFLGNAETLSREDTFFQVVSKKDRIFKRISASSADKFPAATINSQRITPTQILTPQFVFPQSQRTLYERAKQQLLEEYVPTSVLINIKYEVMYFFGPTSKYLKVPEGAPSLNLLAMAKGGLAGKIKKAVQTLLQSKKDYVIDRTYIEDIKDPHLVEIKVSFLKKEQDNNLFIVTFKEMEITNPIEPKKNGIKSNVDLIKTLERELMDARNYLQNTIEDLKESNDELKIYNEEIISVNEELQVTNEEMETSKEELQSLNEELTVVNSQLQEKIEELDKTNNDLVNLLRSTDIATIFLDDKLYLKLFTPEAVKMFNLRESDLGRPLKDITMRFVDPTLMSDAQMILEKNKSIEREVETEGKEWYLRKCRTYETVEGIATGVIITFANVTRIKKLQLAALDNEKKLLETFDTLPISIAYVDRHLKYHFNNIRYNEFLGITTKTHLDRLESPPSSQVYEVIKPYIKKVLSGKIMRFDNKVLSASNILHYEEIFLIPEIDDEQEIKGFFIIILDVSDRQRAAISFLKAVIDISPDPLCVVDDHNRLMIMNIAFSNKIGKTENELIGHPPQDFYPKREADIIIKENKKALENGYFKTKKHLFSPENQDLYVVEKRFFESQNGEKYIVCSFQDVTEAHDSKKKLENTVRKLKSVNEDLKNFAHVCSHDLQEPARIILSFSKLFSDQYIDLVDEEGKKYLHYILDGSQRMQKMIEATLAYAKISKENLDMKPVDCEILIASILKDLKPSIDEFNAFITHDKLPTIMGDEFKFYQLFQNIISNALKFRHKQNPEIHIGVKDSKLGYTFFVKDNGIGFNMDFKDKLFKLFGRLNKSEDYPGVGIGLAICKKIVEDSGGKIWVESNIDKGTTFFFNIPQKTVLK